MLVSEFPSLLDILAKLAPIVDASATAIIMVRVACSKGVGADEYLSDQDLVSHRRL